MAAERRPRESPEGTDETPSADRNAENGEAPREVQIERERNPVARFFKLLGPGLITGAADDDPTAIGTYSAAGAAFGYVTLWTTLVTVPMMAAVQYISAKVALVSGQGLGELLREHYPRPITFAALFALVISNAITAGADLGAIAAAINLLAPSIPIAPMVAPIAAMILALLILGSYDLIANVFKWMALALVTYIGAALLARPDPIQALKGTFVPTISLDPQYLTLLVAMLGTNVSAYLLFWQAAEELEEHPRQRRRRFSRRREHARGHVFGPRGEGQRPRRRAAAQQERASAVELKYVEWDTIIGMIFSNVVLYFLNLAAAATLFAAGKHDVRSATDAAAALRPLLGDLATILFAVGLIGSGFIAVPVLAASSAYALSEAFGWRGSLARPLTHAWRFYGVIAISMLGGMALNFVGINPISALVFAAAINGLMTPPLLVLVMLLANNRPLMGNRVNGIGSNVLGWLTTAAMFAAAIGLIYTLVI